MRPRSPLHLAAWMPGSRSATHLGRLSSACRTPISSFDTTNHVMQQWHTGMSAHKPLSPKTSHTPHGALLYGTVPVQCTCRSPAVGVCSAGPCCASLCGCQDTVHVRQGGGERGKSRPKCSSLSVSLVGTNRRHNFWHSQRTGQTDGAKTGKR